MKPRGYQVRMWLGQERRHAKRLKPSTLAGEDKAWRHARRLKPSSLANKD